MERSLDPELLGLALSQHESLPSPSELSALLAQAELAVLLRRPEVSDDLLATGWYLHGIATSKYALETYGIERQRAAFQVAGHLFDLFLRSPSLVSADRLKYCFAAQIAYLRGDLDPNAIAIYRRESALLSDQLRLISNFEEIALSCGIALLGFDVGYLYPVTGAIRNEVTDLLGSWSIDDILSTPFGAAAEVASGARDLMSFLLYGRQDLLERARSTLRSAVVAEVPVQDHVFRWVAAHLLNLAGDLERSSIWTVLPPEVPPGIRRAFATGTPRVLTLWPPQLDLVGVKEPGVPNPLSAEAERLIISTPTSGGKTTIAQLLALAVLLVYRTDSRVVPF